MFCFNFQVADEDVADEDSATYEDSVAAGKFVANKLYNLKVIWYSVIITV